VARYKGTSPNGAYHFRKVGGFGSDEPRRAPDLMAPYRSIRALGLVVPLYSYRMPTSSSGQEV
jgi:hypothetical protein